MQTLTWQKIILSILLLSLLVGLSGCQLGKDLEKFTHELSTLPDRIVLALSRLLGGLSDIGNALADSIRNIVGNMTGK